MHTEISVEELELLFNKEAQITIKNEPMGDFVIVDDTVADFDDVLKSDSDDDSDYEPEGVIHTPIPMDEIKAHPEKYQLKGGTPGKNKQASNAKRIGRSQLSKNLIKAVAVINATSKKVLFKHLIYCINFCFIRVVISKMQRQKR